MFVEILCIFKTVSTITKAVTLSRIYIFLSIHLGKCNLISVRLCPEVGLLTLNLPKREILSRCKHVLIQEGLEPAVLKYVSVHQLSEPVQKQYYLKFTEQLMYIEEPNKR